MREIKVYLQHTLLSIYPLTSLEIPSGVEVSSFHPIKIRNKVDDWMNRSHSSEVAIVHPQPMEILQAMKDQMEWIPAAGGLVENEKGELLLMKRRGYWDLPKGKVDEGESLEQTAVREVQEETGLQAVILGAFVGTTYHGYFIKNNPCIKPSHWFWMKVSGNPTLSPQFEEDITEIIWITKEEVDDYFPMALPTVRDLLRIWKEA